MTQERTVLYENNEIHYLLEQKPVKNLNLRIHKDCMVYVSANQMSRLKKIDDFVVGKGAYIKSAQNESFVRWYGMLLCPSNMSVEKLSIYWVEEFA